VLREHADMRALPSSALSTFLLALAACSSSGGASATGGADPIAPTTTTPADVSFYATANSNGEQLVNASFHVMTSGGTACVSEVVAGCYVTTCTKSQVTPTYVDADPGALTVTAAAFGTDVPVPLSGGYGRLVKQGPWAAGDAVELKGAGGPDLPAFDVKATIPPLLADIAFDGCTSTDAQAPCTLSAGGSVVSWSNGAGALVGVSIWPNLDTDTQVGVSCTFPGDAGAGKIPAGALARLAKGLSHRTQLGTSTAAPTIVQGAKFRASVGANRIFMGTTLALKTAG
jgi:hypothetical protein